MDSLQLRLQQMEYTNGRSPSLDREFSLGEKIWNGLRDLVYHNNHNKLKNRSLDNIVQRVPQKSSILAEDVVSDIIQSGRKNLEYPLLFPAEHNYFKAVGLDSKFQTGFHRELRELAEGIISAYINRGLDEVQKGLIDFSAQNTYKEASAAADRLGVNATKKKLELARAIVLKYVEKGLSEVEHNLIDYSAQLSRDNATSAAKKYGVTDVRNDISGLEIAIVLKYVENGLKHVQQNLIDHSAQESYKKAASLDGKYRTNAGEEISGLGRAIVMRYISNGIEHAQGGRDYSAKTSYDGANTLSKLFRIDVSNELLSLQRLIQTK